jgi:hypothetical protein
VSTVGNIFMTTIELPKFAKTLPNSHPLLLSPLLT